MATTEEKKAKQVQAEKQKSSEETIAKTIKVRLSIVPFVGRYIFIQLIFLVLVGISIFLVFFIDWGQQLETIFFIVLIIFFAALFIIDVILAIYLYVVWRQVYYLVSPGTVTYVKGGLNVQKFTYDITHLASVEFEQSWFGRLFDYGTLVLKMPTLDEDLIVQNIQQHKESYNIIKQMASDEQEDLLYMAADEP